VKHRFFVFLSAATIAAPCFLKAQTPDAKPAAKKAWVMPRTPDGKPDLEGIWTNATITRMERLPAFNGKLQLTDAEAAQFERSDRDAATEKPGQDGVTLGGQVFSGANAGYNALFIDRGSELARVDGMKRSSLIIDPPESLHGPPASRLVQAAAARQSPVNTTALRPGLSRNVVWSGSGPPRDRP
jgi:hypothetical protein